MKFTLNKVLIADAVDDEAVNILKASGVEVVVKTGQSEESIKSMVKDFDGIIVRSATKVTAGIIEAANGNLKVIGRAGVGVDNIDTNAATKNGVLVVNAPGGNTLAAAELTCGLILSLARNVAQACARQKERALDATSWTKKDFEADRKLFKGSELNGKILGVIGLGRIGVEVGRRMASFGMKLIGFDVIPDAIKSASENGFETFNNLDAIWKDADFITVHVPLIKPTINMINEEVIMKKCKKGVKIINVARGGIIDEDALLKGLINGQVGGAALDVFVQEPPTNVSKLIQHPNVIVTPHLGASTAEAQVRVAVEIADQFVALKMLASKSGAKSGDAKKLLTGAVNPVVLDTSF